MKNNLLKTLTFMALAFTVAFTTVTPAFATEAETNKVLEEKEDTIETTELEPSAQSLDVDEDNELEEVVKTWVAKNPEYEKEVELSAPYDLYYSGRKEICYQAIIKFNIGKCQGRYVVYATGKDRAEVSGVGTIGENYKYFIIPHNGYYTLDFDEIDQKFYDTNWPYMDLYIADEYKKP